MVSCSSPSTCLDSEVGYEAPDRQRLSLRTSVLTFSIWGACITLPVLLVTVAPPAFIWLVKSINNPLFEQVQPNLYLHRQCGISRTSPKTPKTPDIITSYFTNNILLKSTDKSTMGTFNVDKSWTLCHNCIIRHTLNPAFNFNSLFFFSSTSPTLTLVTVECI